MSVHLQDHAEALAGLEPLSRDLFDRSWPQALQLLSARGLKHYVQGACALQTLGRGAGPVDAWIDAAPQVAQELGEEVLRELHSTALQLASKTSGAVIERMLATAPLAARRLADAELFGQYLRFLGVLVAQAPRGVRPMLGQLDVLLGQLTLGGLRRWATWGAQAHRNQAEEQLRYFGLESREALAMLQQERKGTLLVDVQRRIQMYLRALWARDFHLRPSAGDFETREGLRPFIEDQVVHLPDALDAVGGVGATELYRAAAAHAAAHLVHTRRALSAESLTPWQVALIGLVEDARVEALAIARFPGLRALWASLHMASAAQDARAADWLERLARALIDPAFDDPHPWVAQGRALFGQALPQILARPFHNAASTDIGLALAHSYPGPRFQPRADQPRVAYRDDNRYSWAFDGFDDAALQGAPPTSRQVRKQVGLMAFVNELEVETAGDDAQEVWVLGTELFPYEDLGVSFNSALGREPMAPPVHYPEWDHRIQLERPAWVTVQERHPALGDGALIDAIRTRHRGLIGRMKGLLQALQPQGVQRLRKLEDGDDIDLNAALSSLVDQRMGRQPDPRVMLRNVRRQRDISVLVLLDLSHSTNERLPGQDRSVLDLTREACVLLADAIHTVGDPFAIHGFCSDGRHDVRYWRFKDFSMPYNDLTKARLAGMTGQLSTRLGAAIRHATVALAQQKSARKLLLVITDGEPADIDERDPQHLRHDSRKAVEAAARGGVLSYCMSLDPRADPYVSRIFGARHHVVVDRVEQLPEKLPLLYAGLTR